MFKKIVIFNKICKIVDSVERYYKGHKEEIENIKKHLPEIKNFVKEVEEIIKNYKNKN